MQRLSTSWEPLSQLARRNYGLFRNDWAVPQFNTYGHPYALQSAWPDYTNRLS